jgi:lipopolysaccharide biosynthesis protein
LNVLTLPLDHAADWRSGQAVSAVREPARLTDIGQLHAGSVRVLHGLGTRTSLGFLGRMAGAASRLAVDTLLDHLAPQRGEILQRQTGQASGTGASLAIYVHWSASGRVSEMVLRQLAGWRGQGVDVVFVTNSAPPVADIERVREHCVLYLRRSNIGLDFGAWRDGLAAALAEGAVPQELLLANDSVVGPLAPLGPLVERWREGGGGFFGMTESLAGGVHLQSYLLLARGPAAIADMAAHLAGFADVRNKWRVVQSGEIGLTQKMMRAGHRCAALFDYARLCALARPSDFAALGARFNGENSLCVYPLNPTHHFWRLLLERTDFPFLKTSLIAHNAGRLPGVERWRDLLGAEDVALIDEHLGRLSNG